MKEITPQARPILNEWKERLKKYEHAKQELKDVLGKYGVASSQFNAARVEFEMLKEEFDAFEKENHAIIKDYK